MKKRLNYLFICALVLSTGFTANANTSDTPLLDENCEIVLIEEVNDCQLYAYSTSALVDSGLVRFGASVNTSSNTTVTVTTFQVILQSGSSIFASGSFNAATGLYEGAITVSCSNPVSSVIFHVNGRAGRSNTCYTSSTTTFHAGNICSGSSGIGLFN